MTEELGTKEVRALAVAKVSVMPEVIEALESLTRIRGVIDRANKACGKCGSANATEAASTGDIIADKTSDAMVGASERFRRLVWSIDELTDMYS